MKKMQFKIIFWSILGLIAMISFYFGGKSMDKQWESDFNFFNSANLHHLIEGVDIYAKGDRIILKDTFYVFYPYTTDLDYKFLDIAKKGDSVIKKPYSDTLVLKKPDGKIYRYTFRNLEKK